MLLQIVQLASPQSPLAWCLDHLAVVGWPTLLVLCWKLRGVIDRYLKKAEETHIAVADTKAAVDVMQSNHLTHVEADMKSMRETSDKSIEVLMSIDKNIAVLSAVLVDRNRE